MIRRRFWAAGGDRCCVGERQRKAALKGQVTIDLPDLERYYHVTEIAGRRPLIIVRNRLSESEPRLQKFGEPVQFVSARSLAPETPFLEFTRLDIAGDTARVEFGYPVEGVRGFVTLVRHAGSWEIVANELMERR